MTTNPFMKIYVAVFNKKKQQEYTGWAVFEKLFDGTFEPCCIDSSSGDYGLCGYIYVYPKRVLAILDMNDMIDDWKKQGMTVSRSDFKVQKVKVVIDNG